MNCYQNKLHRHWIIIVNLSSGANHVGPYTDSVIIISIVVSSQCSEI